MTFNNLGCNINFTDAILRFLAVFKKKPNIYDLDTNKKVILFLKNIKREKDNN